MVGCKEKSSRQRRMFQAQAADSATSGVRSSAIAASFSSRLLRTSGLVSGFTLLGLKERN